MKTSTKNPLSIARQIAKDEFENYLDQMNSCATMHVPDCVILAANEAYSAAGGQGEIIVFGHGNRTHPVCGVDVKRKAKQ